MHSSASSAVVIVVAVACWSSDSWDVGTGVVLSDAVVLGSGAGTTADGVSVRVELANLGSWLISFLCVGEGAGFVAETSPLYIWV